MPRRNQAVAALCSPGLQLFTFHRRDSPNTIRSPMTLNKVSGESKHDELHMMVFETTNIALTQIVAICEVSCSPTYFAFFFPRLVRILTSRTTKKKKKGNS